MRHTATTLFILVGITNLLPFVGVLGAERLESLYDLPLAGQDLLLLMRHRAVLFGVLGAFLIVAAFRVQLRVAATVAGLVSIFGNPWDVVLDEKIALADQMRNDLRQELQSLGLVESSSAASRQIAVGIRDWNFDAGVEGRFWYDVELTVADSHGQILATSRVKEDQIIEGNLLVGAKWAMEEAIPAFYRELIKKLVRENPATLEGLRVER